MISDELASFLLLGGAAVAGYAAARGAIDALIPPDEPAPAKRGLVHACMTAIVGLAAMLHHPAQLDIVAGLPFATAVAALALALGVVVYVTPAVVETGPAATPHRTWAFVLPTALITLLIGFSGTLSPGNALILATQGAAIVLVCVGRKSETRLSVIDPQPIGTLTSVPYWSSGETDEGGAARSRHRRMSLAQAIASLALALVAAWGMVQGAAGLALHSPAFRPGVAAAIVLGPAIVLPMIPPVATLAERGRSAEAITTLIAFALINLCLVLPILILARNLMQEPAQSYLPSHVLQMLHIKSSPATEPSVVANLPFPILVWRLDTVLLSIIGLLVLPVSIGKWKLSRQEGVGLIALYAVYLFLTLLISHA